uniref:ABC transmembrane type-1 domain-containing protein n=1 Tax=Phytophthora ramorum TaxID=164328 RepID=H3GF27_PHYRM
MLAYMMVLGLMLRAAAFCASSNAGTLSTPLGVVASEYTGSVCASDGMVGAWVYLWSLSLDAVEWELSCTSRREVEVGGENGGAVGLPLRSSRRTGVTRFATPKEVLCLVETLLKRTLLFQKTLRRNAAKAPPAEAVDVSNLFTSDANSVSTVAHYINSAWILPVQIGGVVYMLYWVIGAAAFAGLAVIGASSLAGVLVGKVSVDAFRNMMQQRDGRMKAIKEVFGAIQVVKLNAWEDKFAARVAARRATELRALRSFLLSCSLEELVVWASPLLVSIVSLAVYSVGMGQPLTAAKVFTALALFNALRTPLQDLPSVIQSCLHAKVALDRISSYLAHADYRVANVRRTDPSQAEYVDVSVTNGSFGWKADAPVLTNVHFTAKKGDLVVVRGAVGAGK